MRGNEWRNGKNELDLEVGQHLLSKSYFVQNHLLDVPAWPMVRSKSSYCADLVTVCNLLKLLIWLLIPFRTLTDSGLQQEHLQKSDHSWRFTLIGRWIAILNPFHQLMLHHYSSANLIGSTAWTTKHLPAPTETYLHIPPKKWKATSPCRHYIERCFQPSLLEILNQWNA